MSMILSNLTFMHTMNSYRYMNNFFANFLKNLEVCKQYSKDLANVCK